MDPVEQSDYFIISDVVTDCEARFALPDLIECEYFKLQRRGYYRALEARCLNSQRNYVALLECLDEINAHDEQHGKSFAKRFRESSKDLKNCEAIFSEALVYRAYIRPVHEGLIRGIRLEEAESDIIVERLDGSEIFLEVFCVMPSFPILAEGEKPRAYSVMTHTQDAMGSIRQKLLHKISEQGQLSKPRENFAVIELNDVTIAGDFAVLSSLSGGYKMNLAPQGNVVRSRGYDWNDSVFDDPRTQWLKGVIYFSLGDYESRKYIFNPNFKPPS